MSAVLFEQPYVELANSYGTGQITELETFVQTNTEKFASVSFLKCVLFFFNLLHVQQHILEVLGNLT